MKFYSILNDDLVILFSKFEESTCKNSIINSVNNRTYVKSYGPVLTTSGDETTLAEYLLQNGPVSVYVINKVKLSFIVEVINLFKLNLKIKKINKD